MVRFIVLWVFLIGTPTVMLAEDKAGMTALCRINCLQKLFVPGKNTNCLGNWDCCSCWYWCHRLFSDSDIYRRMCIKNQYRGCKEAFEFHLLHPTTSKNITWQYENPSQTLEHHYQPELDIILFEWSLPDTHESWRSEPLVYAIQVQDQSLNDWRTVEQTILTNATISRTVLGNFLSLRLVTYFSEGVVGDIEISYRKFNFTDLKQKDHEQKSDSDKNDSKSLYQPNDLNSLETALGKTRNIWTPFIYSLKYSNVYNLIDASFNWTEPFHDTQLLYEIEWRVTDKSSLETGRLHTMKTFIKILLFSDTVYNVTIRALILNSSGFQTVMAQIGPLSVNAVAEPPSQLQHTFLNSLYFPFFVITIIITIIIIVCMLVLHIYYTKAEQKKSGNSLFQMGRLI